MMMDMRWSLVECCLSISDFIEPYLYKTKREMQRKMKTKLHVFET